MVMCAHRDEHLRQAGRQKGHSRLRNRVGPVRHRDVFRLHVYLV